MIDSPCVDNAMNELRLIEPAIVAAAVNKKLIDPPRVTN
jgi:hypothetical protein